MAGRIRTIKPELRELLAFASLSDPAARLFVMLYTLVDDAGNCPAGPQYLNGQVFYMRPRGAVVIGRLVGELEAAGLVKRYEVDRSPMVSIVGWRDPESPMHQRIDKPQKPRFQTPPWFHSENHFAPHSQTYQLPPTGTGTKDRDQEREAIASTALFPPAPDGWKPPAGGAAAKTARKRIEAGEITRDDVDRCYIRFLADAGPFNDAKHRDNTLASWLRQEHAGVKSSRSKRPDLVTDHAEYLELPWEG